MFTQSEVKWIIKANFTLAKRKGSVQEKKELQRAKMSNLGCDRQVICINYYEFNTGFKGSWDEKGWICHWLRNPSQYTIFISESIRGKISLNVSMEMWPAENNHWSSRQGVRQGGGNNKAGGVDVRRVNSAFKSECGNVRSVTAIDRVALRRWAWYSAKRV